MPGDGVSRLSPVTWPGPLAVFTGAGVLFVGYEGFGLITNAAANMASPKRQLPRAIYGSVAVASMLYVLVAFGVVSNVPLDVLKGLGDSALAVAAKPSLGQAGFGMIAVLRASGGPARESTGWFSARRGGRRRRAADADG